MRKYISMLLLLLVPIIGANVVSQSVTRLVFVPLSPAKHTFAEMPVETRAIVARRLKDAAIWGRVTADENTVTVLAWRVDDEAALTRQLTQSGRVSLIDTGVEFPHLDGYSKISTDAVADPDHEVYRLVLDHADFLAARVISDEDFGVLTTLRPQSAAKLHDFLAVHQGVYLCLAVDDVFAGCPVVKLTDTELVFRRGPTDFLVDAPTLAVRINSPPLPVTLMRVNAPD